MSTKVEPSAIEPHATQSSVTANTSTVSSGTKISFVAKKGFLIPKNKLSGSLVPILRGGKKERTSDVVVEESNKQLQRKSKWGPDMSQDAAVRKARALAYQTRVDQITDQLKSGFLDIEDNQESLEAAQNLDLGEGIHQKSELLELERREAIGEILRLNPSYKAPSDYKPLLKEAKVPVPIKEHPGYNFIGMIFGPSSDTLKRLEKETGAKVRLYGTKSNTREKTEITSSDANEAHGAFEELYILISADTYEKVDAAVALIELLVKPVLGNQTTVSTTPTSVSSDNVNISDQIQHTPGPNTIAPVGVNQEILQPIMGPTQTPLQAQFLPYSGPWSSQGPPQPPINPPNAPSFFGPGPVSQHPFTPQGHFGASPSPPLPSSTGFSPVARPPGASLGPPLALPHGPHPVSQRPVSAGLAPFTNMPPHMASFIPNQASPIPSSSPVAPIQQAIVPPPTSNQTPIAQSMSATALPPPPLQSRTPSFTPMQSPPFITQKVPNVGNFTFQPPRPQNLPSQAVPRPMMQNMPVPLQNQPYRQVINNALPQSLLEELERQRMNPNRSQLAPSHENSNFGPQGGPRNNLFPVPPSSHGPHVGPRNLAIPFPPRPVNSLHLQQNFPPSNRPQNFFTANVQQLGGNVSASIKPNSGHGAQQVYDPFSPE